jgi:cytokinesis protein
MISKAPTPHAKVCFDFLIAETHCLTDISWLVTLSDLIKEYNELRSGLQVLLEEIERHQSDEREPVPDDQYYKFVSQFQEEAVPKFDELEVRYTAMDIAYKDVVTFFGENASEMKPDEFFGIFKTFTSSWEVSDLL